MCIAVNMPEDRTFVCRLFLLSEGLAEFPRRRPAV
jgi:hypothetical protein